MKVDLHSHSSASDGVLSPRQLVEQAKALELDYFAITDHDTIDGYCQLSASGKRSDRPFNLLSGIELSTQWSGVAIHVVGLNFDLDAVAIKEAVTTQCRARIRRAEMICERLNRKGLEVDLGRIQQLAGHAAVGRPHFAQHMVEIGAVRDETQAFKKWLGNGKPGDVKQTWANLEQVVKWIVEAGGIAVLAHPLKYGMTASKLAQLTETFASLGGRGIEVISGNQTSDQTNRMALLAERYKLLASVGSDFHSPDNRWSRLGSVARLPDRCRPIWNHF